MNIDCRRKGTRQRPYTNLEKVSVGGLQREKRAEREREREVSYRFCFPVVNGVRVQLHSSSKRQRVSRNKERVIPRDGGEISFVNGSSYGYEIGANVAGYM